MKEDVLYVDIKERILRNEIKIRKEKIIRKGNFFICKEDNEFKNYECEHLKLKNLIPKIRNEIRKMCDICKKEEIFYFSTEKCSEIVIKENIFYLNSEKNEFIICCYECRSNIMLLCYNINNYNWSIFEEYIDEVYKRYNDEIRNIEDKI